MGAFNVEERKFITMMLAHLQRRGRQREGPPAGRPNLYRGGDLYLAPRPAGACSWHRGNDRRRGASRQGADGPASEFRSRFEIKTAGYRSS